MIIDLKLLFYTVLLHYLHYYDYLFLVNIYIIYLYIKIPYCDYLSDVVFDKKLKFLFNLNETSEQMGHEYEKQVKGA